MSRFAALFSCLLCGAVATAVDPPKDAWVYKQSTGELSLNGKVVATGYSGQGKGLNKPDQEKEKSVGPIPRGEWAIGEKFDSKKTSKHALPLTPKGHDAHGRTDFQIHGDNDKGDQSASEGCIILPLDARKKVSDSGVTKLLVVE